MTKKIMTCNKDKRAETYEGHKSSNYTYRETKIHFQSLGYKADGI